MMKAVEYGNCCNAPDWLPLMVVLRYWDRDPLTDTLMGTSVVEVVNVGIDGAPKMTLTQDQNVIQALTADAAQETLAEGIGFWSLGGCA